MKTYKIYYTYTEQCAVCVEANTQEEAEDKFWEFDIVEGSKETIMGFDNDEQIEEIEELSPEGTQIYETTLP